MRIAYLVLTPHILQQAIGVNIMNMCKSFADLGHEVRFYSPRILPGATSSDLATFYSIGESISVCRLLKTTQSPQWTNPLCSQLSAINPVVSA